MSSVFNEQDEGWDDDPEECNRLLNEGLTDEEEDLDNYLDDYLEDNFYDGDQNNGK